MAKDPYKSGKRKMWGELAFTYNGPFRKDLEESLDLFLSDGNFPTARDEAGDFAFAIDFPGEDFSDQYHLSFRLMDIVAHYIDMQQYDDYPYQDSKVMAAALRRAADRIEDAGIHYFEWRKTEKEVAPQFVPPSS